MKTSLKKAFYLGVIVFTVIAVASVLVGFVFADGDYNIEFLPEDNPEYIGSYFLWRENKGIEWPEWGEWKSSFELFFDSNKCIRFTSLREATFKAEPGWEWMLREPFLSPPCMQLQRIK